MTSVWPVVRMGELCTITSGSSDTQDAVADGEFAFFDRSKIIKRSNRFLHDCEALIIPGEGATFLPRYFRGKFDLHQRAYAIFDLNPKLNIHFLYYCLYFQADYFPRVAVGATVKSLRRRHFEEFPVPLPPLAEQQRIVRLLDEVFEGIAIAKANLEKNLLNARALFRGYLNSAFIEDNDHWQSKNFEDCIQLVQYTRKVQRKHFLSEGRFPIISQEADFNNGFWNDEADLFEVVRPVVIFGDHTRVLKYVDSSFVLGADGVRILSPHEFLNPKFFYYQLLGTDIRSLGYSRHYRLLKEIKIGFPGLEEQARVVSRLDDIARQSQKLADSYAQKLAALELLRASILGQLLMDKSKAA